jgi:phage/plasmid-associated DNA primase
LSAVGERPAVAAQPTAIFFYFLIPVEAGDLFQALNTPNGTIDLRSSGELRKHRPEDYLTKVTGAVLASESQDAPLWLRFLDRITNRDVELQAYLQRVIGYCLTGSI